MQKLYVLVTMLLATLAARAAALMSTVCQLSSLVRCATKDRCRRTAPGIRDCRCPTLLLTVRVYFRCLLRFNRQRSIQCSNLPRKPVDDSKPQLVCAWR